MRECHIEPDWLLIYKTEKDMLILKLIRTGTHSDFFKRWKIGAVIIDDSASFER